MHKRQGYLGSAHGAHFGSGEAPSKYWYFDTCDFDGLTHADDCHFVDCQFEFTPVGVRNVYEGCDMGVAMDEYTALDPVERGDYTRWEMYQMAAHLAVIMVLAVLCCCLSAVRLG
jgi:hypothetical protein